jgi:hypothetical protein
MHLIQLLLPLYDNDGAAFDPALYREIREELTGRFGGLTAFTRAPAEGHWEEDGRAAKDDIVVFEVMAEELDRTWWGGYRETLERMFRQDAIVVRSQQIEML